MKGDFQLELFRRKTTMADSKFLVDEFDSEDRFRGVQWYCFLYAATRSQCYISGNRIQPLTMRKLPGQLFSTQSGRAARWAAAPAVNVLS